VRPMAESDFDFALDLANQEHWEYDLVDLERLFRLFPGGSLVAEHFGAKAGWVLVSSYGSLAWIGSLVVQADLRGKGVGAALLNRAVGYARERGARTVGLYSYSQSVGFYEKMGFTRDCDFEHIEGVRREHLPKASVQRPKDLDEVAKFDSRYFRGNRRRLLEALHREFLDLFISQREADVLGYIAGKSFTNEAAEIGPWVCDVKHVEVAEQLFASELNQLPSKRVSLTIPSQNTEVHRIVREYGFRVKQKVVRMFLGSVTDLPLVDGVYAAAGLDVG